MSYPHQTPANPLYAVIDLGSNSFHMLIARLVADGVQTVDKVKRKVRLASGLDNNNHLSENAIARGLECLSFFAERLQDIAPENVRIVATATLRIASNADEFLTRAQAILKKEITLLSGVEEAERIYLGVAHTSECPTSQLVLDIGGASTELIVGKQFAISHAQSIDIGCVTFNNRFFADGNYTTEAFKNAISYAKQQLSPVIQPYIQHGWHGVLGGSGTMQALAEILIAQNQPAIITLTLLKQVQEKLLDARHIAQVKIKGLASDRLPVLASGVTILIALFESLSLDKLQLSSGALREGLLYEMLPDMRAINIRQRTVQSLSQRFHIDQLHAKRVTQQALQLLKGSKQHWHLDENLSQLLAAICQLHEIGLLLSFKYHQQHGSYILKHTDLPGFDQTERQLMVSLVAQYKGDIDLEALQGLAIVDEKQASQMLILLRLAVLLCRRRQDDLLLNYQFKVTQQQIQLSLPSEWLDTHPLIADELKQENQQLYALGYQLLINTL